MYTLAIALLSLLISMLVIKLEILRCSCVVNMWFKMRLLCYIAIRYNRRKDKSVKYLSVRML